jgi:hypothetical protein
VLLDQVSVVEHRHRLFPFALLRISDLDIGEDATPAVLPYCQVEPASANPAARSSSTCSSCRIGLRSGCQAVRPPFGSALVLVGSPLRPLCGRALPMAACPSAAGPSRVGQTGTTTSVTVIIPVSSNDDS